MAMQPCAPRSSPRCIVRPHCPRRRTRPCSTGIWCSRSSRQNDYEDMQRVKAGTMTNWLRHLATTAFALTLCAVLPAHAELQIDITSGVTDPIPIAVVPFTRAPADGGVDVSEVVQHDLATSGRFKTMARAQMLGTPTKATDVVAADWKAS